MALKVNDRAIIRAEVGANPDDDTLDEIYDRHGVVGAVIYEVLSRRRADLIANPASFGVDSGAYQQSTAENIRALDRQLERWKAFAPVASGTFEVIEPVRRHRRTPRYPRGRSTDAEI